MPPNKWALTSSCLATTSVAPTTAGPEHRHLHRGLTRINNHNSIRTAHAILHQQGSRTISAACVVSGQPDRRKQAAPAQGVPVSASGLPIAMEPATMSSGQADYIVCRREFPQPALDRAPGEGMGSVVYRHAPANINHRVQHHHRHILRELPVRGHIYWARPGGTNLNRLAPTFVP